MLLIILPISVKCYAGIVAEVIAGEAVGEGNIGLHAVASVISNRARIKNKTPEQIVTQKSQFSAYNAQKRSTRRKHYRKVKKIADKLERQVKTGKFNSIVGNATHFYNPKIYPNYTPYWIKEAEYITTLGNHDFYFYEYF